MIFFEKILMKGFKMNKKSNTNEIIFNDDDVVEYVPNPKYPNNRIFNGQGIITSANLTAKKYVWVNWHYGFGMVLKSELKLADDQTKVIYQQ